MTDSIVNNMRLVRVTRPKLRTRKVAPVITAVEDNVVHVRQPLHKKTNAEMGRTREFLNDAEVKAMGEALGENRNAHRDATMMLTCYRHGFRVSELNDLRWDQIDFGAAVMYVTRKKNGRPSTQPIMGDELRALRRMQREQEPKSAFVFVSERGTPFTQSGFAKMLERAGKRAGIGFKVHPHMLRHTTGFILANKGHDTRSLQGYLGHVNIQHTVVYTELASGRFKDFWR